MSAPTLEEVEAKKLRKRERQNLATLEEISADVPVLKAVPTIEGVKITGFDMPFVELVVFMLKCMFAAIPAVIVFWIFWTMLWTTFWATITGEMF